MRDLLFKDLTSSDKKRRIISSAEIVDKQGVRSIIHRHFVYIVKEITGTHAERPLSSVYVVKKRDTQARKENFFCRVKAGLILANGQRQFLILYTHSLKIRLAAIPAHLSKYSADI
ncbi:MAG: hypothetical protein QME65_05010 [Candidatus Omnitrophota bacterium]|nr:hypothetical protein [Candidatus Omnitrophota bacterium]